MELKFTLEQKQQLSQKMIQSAEILQMDVQELETFVRELAMENPLVELEEAHPVQEGMERVDERKREAEEKLEWLNRMDEQNRVYYKEEYEELEEKEAWNFSVAEENLQDYLLSQLIPYLKTEKDQDILTYLVYSLDSRGYLTDSAEELQGRLELNEDEVLSYLQILKSLDPAGIGAGDLKECLLLQLDRNDKEDETARLVVEEYLDLLGKNQLPQIAAKLGVTLAELNDCCERIRNLNPKPGSCFSSRETLRYIRPDVTIVKFQDYFEVLLNDNAYPRLTINSYYSRMLHEDNSAEVKEYISDKLKQAEWITRCIEQRSETLLKVARAIVEIQRPFFESGAGNRRPMRLADIAERIEMHESTVSRAVRDKYLQCTWGVYPLSYFFVKQVGGTGDDSGETPEQVKKCMEGIIAGEDKKKPLSDQKITDIMNKQGIAISRRTVAKYRMQLGIPDASGRKEFSS